MKALGQVSYAIYLNHLLILLFVNKMVKNVVNKDNLIYQIIIFLITVLVSFFICTLIKTIDKNRARKYWGI